MERILSDFESFCTIPGVDSGKARSYTNAIRYLLDFLNEHKIDANTVALLKTIDPSLRQITSREYQALLQFLTDRRQSSYLTKGFIKAALPYFFEFWEQRV